MQLSRSLLQLNSVLFPSYVSRFRTNIQQLVIEQILVRQSHLAFKESVSAHESLSSIVSGAIKSAAAGVAYADMSTDGFIPFSVKF